MMMMMMMMFYYYYFPRYFSSPFFFLLLSFALSSFLSCLCTRSSNSSNNYFVLLEFLTKEYCLEIECRPILRPGSVVNHGSLSIHMLPLVHFHRDIHLNILLVVVSTKKKKKQAENNDVRVSADDSRGHSMFTHWRVQTINVFFVSFSFGWSISLPSFLSHRFTFTIFHLLKNVIDRQTVAYDFLYYFFFRE